MNAANDDATEA